MRRELGSNSVSKQERLRFESLAILLEAQHDNADARMRHCREAAGILMIRRCSPRRCDGS